MSRFSSISALIFLIAGGLAGCGSSHEASQADGGSDSAVPSADGGGGADAATGVDSSTGVDGGSVDAGTSDATIPPADSGVPPTDSGVVMADGGMPTVPGSVGAACAADGDCDMLTAPTCMTMIGSAGFSAEFPGGYCTQTCTPSFGGTPDDCPTGSACFGGGFGGFGAAFCGKTCSSDSDCRVSEGYTCMSAPFGGGPSVCAPPFSGGMMGSDSGTPFP